MEMQEERENSHSKGYEEEISWSTSGIGRRPLGYKR